MSPSRSIERVQGGDKMVAGLQPHLLVLRIAAPCLRVADCGSTSGTAAASGEPF